PEELPADVLALVWLDGAGGSSEKPRLVRGQATGSVHAEDTTFAIDGIELLAGSLPVSDPLTIVSVLQENLPNNTEVTAIYNDTEHEWEKLVTERYRLIRGQCVADVDASDSTFTIDNIIVIGNGVDPRTDPTSSTETVTITNSQKEWFVENEYVTAIYFETS